MTHHAEMNKFKVLKMNWDCLHVQSREEICNGAAISKRLACRQWKELDLWIQLLLADSYATRSRGRLQLGGGSDRWTEGLTR